MTSFNDNDGVPSTANKFVLKDILRDEWKYDGMVVTDWASAAEMINHGFCADGKEAAEKSVNAGVDMDMVSETFIKNLKQSLAENKVSIESIDDAVRNILRLKYRMGLFENPYIVTPQNVKYAEEHLKIAKEAVEQSVILLKNDTQTLPLTNKNARKFSRFFVAGATTCELDRQGRILVPATLREFAGLEKDVVLTGNLNRIEVWSKAKWSENNDYDDMDAIAEDMQEMGIII